MIDNDKIAKLRRLEAEATPGEWDYGNETKQLFIHGALGHRYVIAVDMDKNDAALIVAMRNALPELLKALEEARTPRPKDEWHEDYGDVVWWPRFEGEWIGEAAWIGTPNDSDWSGHHTHWTPHPAFPLPPHGGVDVG